MKYTGGYKYQLSEDFSILISILPNEQISTDFIGLSKDGHLTIKKGYAWDGCSGPTIDSKNSMRGGLVHDALYQLSRSKLLPKSYRPRIDLIFKEILIADKMFKWRAWIWYQAVRKFASFAANPKNKKEILEAP